jgi:GTP-binding protein
VARDYGIVRRELESKKYNIADKHEIIALTKVELLDKKILNGKKKELEKASGKKVFLISSATREGIDDILRELKTMVQKFKKSPKEYDA